MLLLLAGRCWADARLFVVQYNDESLGRIDPVSGAVNPHVLELGYGCNEIVAHGSRLYVTNSLINTVQEIDAENQVTLRDIPMTGGVNPYALTALNDDTLAVTNFVTDNVLLLRISDGRIVGTFSVGVAPEGILAHGERLYVCLTRYSAQGYGPGRVMIYDRSTLALLDSLAVGVNPQVAAVDDRNRLHVVCTGNYSDVAGEIHVFDLANRESAVVHVGGAPGALSFGGGWAFAAAGGWAGSGQVFRYRLTDLAVLNGADNPIQTGVGAWDVVAMPDGSFYVSCASADLVEHRSAEGALLASYPVGAGPGCMAMYESASATQPGRISPAGSPRLAEAFPNPFNSAVRLRFSVAASRSSNIIIYNNMGQEVNVLNVAAGAQEAWWDPSAGSASGFSTGAYFAVWDGGGRETPLRLLYIR
jgi:hypothetical protein